MNLETKHAEVQALFESALWPRLEHATLQKQSLELKLFVPSTLGYFEGHFPKQPVLPGVVQVHWVGELSRVAFECEGFIAMQNIKFIDMALPEANLELHLQSVPDKKLVKFRYSHIKEEKISIVSSGTLKFLSGEEQQRVAGNV